MTREIGDLGEELEALYGDGLHDLTFNGYTDALQRLRDDDPTTARRVDRRLDPFLRTKAFPRRRREWQETSGGTTARLALLAENPHLEQDVRDVRSALGVPDSQVRVVEGDDLWNQAAEVVRPECVRQEVERQLVGGWHLIHVQTALGREPDEDIERMVSAELRESAQASARVRFDVDEIPSWLRTSSDGPGGYGGPIVPIEWAAGRLIQRHRLPRRVSAALTSHVLTGNPRWLIGLESLDVSVVSGAHLSNEGEPFSVHVGSIDEYFTQDDWDLIWKRYIRPEQKRLWERRGERPRGRKRVDVSRLSKAMPIYRAMVLRGVKMRELLHQPRETWYCEVEDLDQETIRNTIRELERLLIPK